MWIGPRLSPLEWLSIQSFIYHGYTIAVYLYDMDCEVPNGAIRVDARNILPETDIFKAMGSYAIFADAFRYRLLEAVDTIWVDTDCVCMNSQFPMSMEYIFSAQYQGYEPVTNHILKYPAKSEIAQRLSNATIPSELQRIYENSTGDVPWGISGPILVSNTLNEMRLFNYAFHTSHFNPINFSDIRVCFDRAYIRRFIEQTQNSHIVHCSNVFVTLRDEGKSYDKNNIDSDSALGRLYKRIFLNKKERLIINVSLPLSGTQTFSKAASDKGLGVIHHNEAIHIFDIQDHQTRWFAFNNMLTLFDAVSDSPVNHFVSELMDEYPQSTFMLTRREPLEWVKSVRFLWEELSSRPSHFRPLREMVAFIEQLPDVQGYSKIGPFSINLNELSDEYLAALYNKYNAHVEEIAKQKKIKLIINNLNDGSFERDLQNMFGFAGGNIDYWRYEQ